METINRQDFVLTMEEKSNFLHVRASGIRSRDNAQYLSMQVFNTALEKHLSKILLDIRELVGDFGYLDIIMFVKEVLRDLRGKGVDRIAIIDIHRSTREGWFLEPVAQSQGINIRVFPDEELSIKWLGE
jgi:phosphoribosylpyrophosphate synthetase